jgi:hypothetical protein
MKAIITYMAAAACFLCACATEPIVKPSAGKAQIVVDGWIGIGEAPVVLLTFSRPFSSPIDSASYLDYVGTRAKLTVFGNGAEEVLALKRDNNYFPMHLYSAIRMRGRAGETYRLLVEYAGDSVWAETVIPQPVEIDSIWFEVLEPENSAGLLWIKLTDPASYDNYYRIETKVRNLDKRFKGARASAFDDAGFAGTQISLPVFPAARSYSEMMQPGRFYKGDTVDIRLSAIGRNEWQFWSDYDKSVYSSANPFSFGGTNIPGNINGGLGIWCGYGSRYATVICR